jgi:hypothetical protein
MPRGAVSVRAPRGRYVSAAATLVVACLLSAVLPVAAIAVPGLSKWLLALALMGALGVVALWSPYTALLLSLVYVVFQGLLRRLLPDAPGTVDGVGDPLLLVVPVVALFTTLIHARRSKLDLLGKVILAIQVGLALSVLNPLGAGVTSGVAQFIVVALPLTWFWVTSRAVSIDQVRFRRVLVLITTLGVVATAYGRFQVTTGFPPWDEEWIRERGVTSLQIGQFVRPFSTFTAAADYGTFLGLSLMAAAALLLSPNTRSSWARLLLVVACALFIRELVLLGSRGILLTSVVPVAVGLLIRVGLRLRFAIVLGIVGLFLLPTLLGRFGVAAEEDPTTLADAAVARQIEGFSDPFGQDSTLPGHLKRLGAGVTSGFDSPLGLGVGVIGIGGNFREGGGQGTETSYGDLGVSLGLVGTTLALIFAGALLRKVGRQPSRRRDEAYWMLLFLSVLPFGPRMTAGNYAAQVAFYVLLGCAWRLLDDPPDGEMAVDDQGNALELPAAAVGGGALRRR